MKNTINNLLGENKKAMQFLHASNGFDFENDFYIEKLEGRFTFNSVKKMIKANITEEYTAALLIKPTTDYHFNYKMFYVDINGEKFEPLRKNNVTYYGYDVDYTFSIGDFENIRKNKTDHYYIIAQKKEYLKKPIINNSFDNKQRFKYIPSEWGEKCSDGHGNTWINKITIKTRDGAAKEYEYKPNMAYNKGERVRTIEELIDKSGYLLYERRRDLRQRAANLRIEREKNIAAMADYSEQEKAIKTGIENAKMYLAELLLTLDDLDEMHAFNRKADKLKWLSYYYKRHMEKRENKTFSSVAAIERSINELNNYITEIMGDKNNG